MMHHELRQPSCAQLCNALRMYDAPQVAPFQMCSCANKSEQRLSMPYLNEKVSLSIVQ